MPEYIDFLPPQYRERDLHRKNRWWRGLVVLAFVGLLALGWYGLRLKRANLVMELEAARQENEGTLRLSTELGKLAAEAQSLRHQAELAVYLRHPWSRARILRALLDPLPDSISLQELRIGRSTEPLKGISAEQVQRSSQRPAEQPTNNEPTSPADVDLRALRQEADAHPVTVLLTGLSADHASPHRYLAALSKSELFTQAELLGIDPQESRDAACLFRVRLTVLPGYGQPNGPAPPRGTIAAISNVSESAPDNVP